MQTPLLSLILSIQFLHIAGLLWPWGKWPVPSHAILVWWTWDPDLSLRSNNSTAQRSPSVQWPWGFEFNSQPWKGYTLKSQLLTGGQPWQRYNYMRPESKHTTNLCPENGQIFRFVFWIIYWCSNLGDFETSREDNRPTRNNWVEWYMNSICWTVTGQVEVRPLILTLGEFAIQSGTGDPNEPLWCALDE